MFNLVIRVCIQLDIVAELAEKLELEREVEYCSEVFLGGHIRLSSDGSRIGLAGRRVGICCTSKLKSGVYSTNRISQIPRFMSFLLVEIGP